MKIVRLISRIIVGLVFVFSGFVKAVDPYGSMFKFNDYFEAFGMEWFIPFSLFLGVLLCCVEFILGFSFLFNAKIKPLSWLMMLFMTFFLILTFIIAIKNPVSDCGCFGDALVISNWATFYKNIVLIILALIVFLGRNKIKSRFSSTFQYCVLGIGLAIILWVSITSYRHLPLIDFMPWKVGNEISKQVVPTPEIAELYLVYKNKDNNEEYEYTSKNLPYKDTVLWKKLEFVKQNKKVIQEYKEAPIHDFMIDDEAKNDFTEVIIDNPKFQYILVSYDLEKADKDVLKKIIPFYNECKRDSIGFAVLSGSDFSVINVLKNSNNLPYPFYTVDQTALKSVVRSNPGLVLLKDGVVVDKWHYNDFPTYFSCVVKYPKYQKLVDKIKIKNKADSLAAKH